MNDNGACGYKVVACSASSAEETVGVKGGKGRGRKKSPSQSASSPSIVERTRLVTDLLGSLARDRLLVLSSEKGLGKHVLASQLIGSLTASGYETTCIRLAGVSPDTACRKLRARMKESVARQSLDVASGQLLVIDGLWGMEDPFFGRVTRTICSAVFGNCLVLIILREDSESLLEFLPPCRVVRAGDLIVDDRELSAWEPMLGGLSAKDVMRCTHGIPSLISNLRVTRVYPGRIPSGSYWNRCVGDLFSNALRPSLIEEELELRLVLLALGKGEVSNLSSLGIRVSGDILAEMAETCPLFGIDLRNDRFDVVPCEDSVVAKALIEREKGNEELIASLVKHLAANGKMRRASAIALASSDQRILKSLVGEYPLEMIDAGLTGAVVRTVLASGRDPRMCAAARIIELFGVGKDSSGVADAAAGFMISGDRAKIHEQQIKLLEAMRRCRSEKSGSLSSSWFDSSMSSSHPLVGKLALMGKALSLGFDMSFVEVFREMLLAKNDAAESNDPSALSAVLAIYFEAARELVGDPPNLGDAATVARAEELLAGDVPPQMRNSTHLVLSAARVLSGSADGSLESDRCASSYAARGEWRAASWANLAGCFSDFASTSFRRAHVHAAAAFGYAKTAGDEKAIVVARIMERATLLKFGESGDLGSAWEVGTSEASSDLVLLDRLHEALGRRDAEGVSTLVDEMGETTPSLSSKVLVSYLAKYDGVVGQRILRELPPSWVPNREPSCVGQGDASVAFHASLQNSTVPFAKGLDPGGDPVLDVNVLGGFSARKGGIKIREGAWRRRRARDLLAMLALTPGHTMSRAEAIVQLWPEMDLIRGRESFYSVLSALRAACGQVAGEIDYIASGQGRIWLDETLVRCDVDEFERLARLIVGGGLPETEVVALCLKLEGLYRGGSYVPISDPDGKYRRRHEELSQRYVDAMLKGSEAALRLNDERQSKWFRENVRMEVGATSGARADRSALG